MYRPIQVTLRDPNRPEYKKPIYVLPGPGMNWQAGDTGITGVNSAYTVVRFPGNTNNLIVDESPARIAGMIEASLNASEQPEELGATEFSEQPRKSTGRRGR
jgi:hypothetical protein